MARLGKTTVWDLAKKTILTKSTEDRCVPDLSVARWYVATLYQKKELIFFPKTPSHTQQNRNYSKLVPKTLILRLKVKYELTSKGIQLFRRAGRTLNQSLDTIDVMSNVEIGLKRARSLEYEFVHIVMDKLSRHADGCLGVHMSFDATNIGQLYEIHSFIISLSGVGGQIGVNTAPAVGYVQVSEP